MRKCVFLLKKVINLNYTCIDHEKLTSLYILLFLTPDREIQCFTLGKKFLYEPRREKTGFLHM